VSAVKPKSALAGSQIKMQVTGTALALDYSFQPGSSSPIVISNVAASPDATTASLSLTIPSGTAGTFALVATNSSGISDTQITPQDRFTVVDPNSTADSDGDGYPDVVEAAFGTDPLDPNSYPTSIQNLRETESVAFSLLNAPITGSGSTETESVAFSLLNASVTASGSTETESTAFSLLNASVTGSGSTETESIAFSLLNASVTNSGSTETESQYFTVLNNTTDSNNTTASRLAPSTTKPSDNSNSVATETQNEFTAPDPFLDSDGDGLPDWYELKIGTDPFNPDTDGDGLSDYDEIFVYHTNPLVPDSDGDGFSDGDEVLFGSDPLDPNSTPLTVVPKQTGMNREPSRSNTAQSTPAPKNTKSEGGSHVTKSSTRTRHVRVVKASAVSSSPGYRTVAR
jgi:hypothetical protein